jgi:hypothetical protein
MKWPKMGIDMALSAVPEPACLALAASALLLPLRRR